jgi:aminoglycoside phosphotransferase (APT) family kinase protein
LLHGDAHVGNTYIAADGTFGLLDWQNYCAGYWVHDVAYFLIGALDVPDRRRAERDLIAHYVLKRTEGGARAADLSEAWEEYRRATFYGFLVWLGNLDLWQKPEVNLAQFARFGTAMIDNDCYGALRL